MKKQYHFVIGIFSQGLAYSSRNCWNPSICFHAFLISRKVTSYENYFKRVNINTLVGHFFVKVSTHSW